MKKRKDLQLKMAGVPPTPVVLAKSEEVLDSERVAEVNESKSAQE